MKLNSKTIYDGLNKAGKRLLIKEASTTLSVRVGAGKNQYFAKDDAGILAYTEVLLTQTH